MAYPDQIITQYFHNRYIAMGTQNAMLCCSHQPGRPTHLTDTPRVWYSLSHGSSRPLTSQLDRTRIGRDRGYAHRSQRGYWVPSADREVPLISITIDVESRAAAAWSIIDERPLSIRRRIKTTCADSCQSSGCLAPADCQSRYLAGRVMKSITTGFNTPWDFAQYRGI